MRDTVAPASIAQVSLRERIHAYVELTKPGITRLVLVTTAAGFYLGARSTVQLSVLFAAMVGTGLAASGCNALNQVMERDHDAQMRRTRSRPVPSGRISPSDAAFFSWLISLVGIALLVVAVNVTTALVVAVCLLSYLFVYTPLKRRTPWATHIGAVPGALPIVAGWTASGGSLNAEAAVLFMILFLWQMPHFFALGWIYRDDYRSGGFQLLSANDAGGRKSGAQALWFTVALLAVSLVPVLYGTSGVWYGAGAAIFGLGFAAVVTRMARKCTDRNARNVFLASITYLPAILFLMVLDKVLKS